jgi:hypothetical protein
MSIGKGLKKALKMIIIGQFIVLIFITVIGIESWSFGQSNIKPLPNGTTISGLSVGIAKIEREGDIVKLLIACRKLAQTEFSHQDVDVFLLDDRGNTYRTVGMDVHEKVPIKILPIGFTWIYRVEINMPKQAPLKSVSFGNKAMQKLNFKFPYYPQSELDYNLKIINNYDITNKWLRISRDILIQFGKPVIEGVEKVEREVTKWVYYIHVPIKAKNEDYNPRRVEANVYYRIYLSSGEITWGLQSEGRAVISTLQGYVWTIPAQTTEESYHIVRTTVLSEKIKPISIIMIVELSLSRKLYFGFLPISEKSK